MEENAMLHARTLETLPGVSHGFFTRTGGVSRGIYGQLNCGLGSRDERARVLQNRAHICGLLGVAADRLATCYQAHTADCVIVEQPFSPEAAPRADALVTRTRGIALGVSSADCTPVLFADAGAGVVGAAHAGWRGALAGVLEACIEKMIALGAEREHIQAAIGPTISQKNYEVGPEVLEAFIAKDPTFGRFFIPSARSSHRMFDLPGLVAARLSAAGIGSVEDLKLCTYADPERFFSYRRMTHQGETDYGRHLHAIALC